MSDPDEFVFTASDSYLFCMCDTCFPVCIRVHIMELVLDVFNMCVMVMPADVGNPVPLEYRCGIDEVGACAVKGYGVERCCHAKIRHYCRVVVVPAVAFR